MRRALLVGIDHYPTMPLRGCINDATAMLDVLSTHDDGDPNFDCQLIVSSHEQSLTKARLTAAIEKLFEQEAEVVLLFFSGHGSKKKVGGFLVTQDATPHDEGVPMDHVIRLATEASGRIREVVILLDCCHSGEIANDPIINTAELRKGISILTASGPTEAATERGGRGVFTELVVDALRGGASDVLGEVTVASVFAYLDQTLGAWDQRPHFKAHVSKLVSLRTGPAHIEKKLLRNLPTLFPVRDGELALDPSFEPKSSNPEPKNCAIFAQLQKLRAARLVEPVGHDHLYDAAMASKSCRLTGLGRFYWTVAKKKKWN